MTTTQLLKRAITKQAIADALGITASAVCQWGDEIPVLRLYQLRELRPEWFAPANRKGN